MFDNLGDRIREDDHKEVSRSERVIRLAAIIVVLSILLFGGLFFGIRMLE
jgi:hypothetical protein